jgi:hypothetical protein
MARLFLIILFRIEKKLEGVGGCVRFLITLTPTPTPILITSDINGNVIIDGTKLSFGRFIVLT